MFGSRKFARASLRTHNFTQLSSLVVTRRIFRIVLPIAALIVDLPVMKGQEASLVIYIWVAIVGSSALLLGVQPTPFVRSVSGA